MEERVHGNMMDVTEELVKSPTYQSIKGFIREGKIVGIALGGCGAGRVGQSWVTIIVAIVPIAFQTLWASVLTPHGDARTLAWAVDALDALGATAVA